MGPHSLALDVLPQGRCKSVIPNLQTLTGQQDCKDHCNNIMVNTSTGDIVLDCQIKTCNGWVAEVDFLDKANNERAVSATTLPKKNINNIHVDLGYPSENITQATTKALGIQVTGTFKPCEECALGKAKQSAVSKKAVHHSKMLGERLFLYITSPTIPTFGSKHHWLLIVDDCSKYIWSFFLKEKSNLMETMLGF